MKIKLVVALLSVILINSYAQRGRVQIQNGTLVSDKGTLLRGMADLSPYSGFNWQDIKEDISSIKKFGLNALHLYAESADVFEPGDRVAFIDSLVKWTREDSLYLIMTATWEKNSNTIQDPEWIDDINFMREFWQFYAPRYKNETHMIFEICNEPSLPELLLDSLALSMERSCYDTIRKYAPETHIMFMSYPGTPPADSAIRNIRNLGVNIDWSNASIASHGYGTSSEEYRKWLRTIQDSGFAVTTTEIPVVRFEDTSPDHFINMSFTRMHEEESISYLHFLSLNNIVDQPSLYKNKIESSEIRWIPDFNEWPANVLEINYRNPYNKIQAAFCDESDREVHIGYKFTTWIVDTTTHNKAYLAFYNLDFEESPDSVILTFSFTANPGTVAIHLDSVNGPQICSEYIPTISYGKSTSLSFPINGFTGIHKIYLKFISSSHFVGVFDDIRFVNNSMVSIDKNEANKSSFSFYPNPASNYLTIQSSGDGKIEIYSLLGNLLLNKKIVDKDQLISTEYLEPGNYIIRLVSPSETKSEILTVQ